MALLWVKSTYLKQEKYRELTQRSLLKIIENNRNKFCSTRIYKIRQIGWYIITKKGENKTIKKKNRHKERR